jgi:hypothetical protein
MVIVDHPREAPPPPIAQREFVYFGGHPIPDEYGGGWCIAEGAHTHPYLPVAQEQYTYQSGGFAFRNDTEWWDYEYGHPFPAEYGGGWCDIVAVHRHRFRPWITYWWNPDRHVFVYVSDARPVPGERIVRGTRPKERTPPRVITIPATPAPPSGTVARPVPVKPTNPSGDGPVATPVPVRPFEPAPSPPARSQPVKPVEAYPLPRTRPERVEIDVPDHPPVTTMPRTVPAAPPGFPSNPARPPTIAPVRPTIPAKLHTEPPRYQEPPPPINPHRPVFDAPRTVPGRPAFDAPRAEPSRPSAVMPAPVRESGVMRSAPSTSSTRSVISPPAVRAAPVQKAPASVVKSQRR